MWINLYEFFVASVLHIVNGQLYWKNIERMLLWSIFIIYRSFQAYSS